MIKLVFVLATPLLLAARLLAHDAITTKLTWTQEVSRLVYRHCASCHREGGASFSLTTYAEARPWAKAIRDEVLERRMPPWGLVKGVGEFHGDPSLSLPEIDMFVTWVEGGAPEGDPALLPSRLPAIQPRAGSLRTTRILNISGETKLAEPIMLIGIRPASLQPRQSLEAWATKPDGTVERIIWLRDFQAAAATEYRLRKPLRFPRGTRIQIAAPPGAVLSLLCDLKP